ncbi:hypothetical protein Tco_0115779 [Tanacetum coccineum]
MEISIPLGYRASMDRWRGASPSTCHLLFPSKIPSSSSPPSLLPSSSSPPPLLLSSSSRKRSRSPSPSPPLSVSPSPLPLVVPPPPEHIESIGDDIETLHASLASAMQETMTFRARVRLLEQHDVDIEASRARTEAAEQRAKTLQVSLGAARMDVGDLIESCVLEYARVIINNYTAGHMHRKPEIEGNVNFEIKSQFMREFREDTFSGNKDEDAHDHIDRVLSIVGLFNILGVSKDAVMLRVFLFTLSGSAKRWVDRLAPGTINTWDLLKKSFIQRYCPPSITTKQLEYIHNFKQEGDESLYQAWERYNDLLYKCPTHDINSHQKVNIFYKGLSTMNRQLLDSQGPIPGIRPAQALIAIQTMLDHSQKWHDGTTSRNIRSSSSKDGLAALVNKLDNLGRDMKKLKESVHAIQVGCQICEGPHLDKDCPLNEEVRQVEDVRYGEFGQTTPFDGNNGGKFHVRPPGYYTKTDNRPPYGERRQNLEELLAKHQEEYAQRSTEMEGLNKLHGVSFISGFKSNTPNVLQHQLPPKELNPGSFTLPCTIGKFNFYAMVDLDMSKKAPLGIVENIRVKIDKFLFPVDFIILYNTLSETTILGRPFLATIYAEIDGNNQIDYEESGNWDNRSPNFDDWGPKKWKINLDENVPRAYFCNPIKQNIKNKPNGPSVIWQIKCDGGVNSVGKIQKSQLVPSLGNKSITLNGVILVPHPKPLLKNQTNQDLKIRPLGNGH